MNFVKYNAILLVSAFPAILLFSFGLIACLAPLALFMKSKKPPLIAVIPSMILAGAFQLYYWGIWSAYCVATTYKFTLRPTVTWDWIYFVAGFLDASFLIAWLSHKERQGESAASQKEIASGTMYYALAAWLAFITFAIWPKLMIRPYGWALDRLGLLDFVK